MHSQEHIFKAIDIRGLYGSDIDERAMERIGESVAVHTHNADIVTASDVRLSSDALRVALGHGLAAAGSRVVDAGQLPIGVASYYARKTHRFLAYVTASHLPPEYNGVKIFHPQGSIFTEQENAALKQLFFSNRPTPGAAGHIQNAHQAHILNDYGTFLRTIHFARPLGIAFDFGNGATALLASVLRNQPFSPVFLFDVPDGRFPSRSPDPTTDPLTAARAIARTCDITFAFDGDGDRVVVLDDRGRLLSVEQFTLLILGKLFRTERGDVVANVECSNIIDNFCRLFGRSVHRVKVGHTYMINAVEQQRACFGVEKSWHCILPAVAPFHDVIPVALYAASALADGDKPLSALVDDMPQTAFLREAFTYPLEKKDDILASLTKEVQRTYEHVSLLDGIRVDVDDGWVLIRPSNTEPILRLTVEACNEERRDTLTATFRSLVAGTIEQFS